jgi:hypothetical protein
MTLADNYAPKIQSTRVDAQLTGGRVAAACKGDLELGIGGVRRYGNGSTNGSARRRGKDHPEGEALPRCQGQGQALTA